MSMEIYEQEIERWGFDTFQRKEREDAEEKRKGTK